MGSTATAAAILQAEKAVFNAVCKHPLTRILGQPTRTQRDKLVEEISNLTIECNVTYEWAGDYGLLVEIMGNGAFLLLTGKDYTEPKEPPKYPTDLDEDSTKDKQDRATAELDEEKIAYAMQKDSTEECKPTSGMPSMSSTTTNCATRLQHTKW